MIIAIIFTFVAGLAYLKTARDVWDIVDTPTVTPSGAIIGLCEVNGFAAPAKTPSGQDVSLMRAPISDYPCVWFEIKVEWYDNSGKNGGWKIFRRASSNGGIRLADKYGSISVIPEKASRYLTKTFENNQTREAIARAYHYFSQFPTGADAIAWSLWSVSEDGYYMWHPNLQQWIPTRYVSPDRKYYFDWVRNRWFEVAPKKMGIIDFILSLSNDKWSYAELRVTETAIFPNQEIFTHGTVRVSENGTDLEISKNSGTRSSFYLSSLGEGKVLKSLKIRKWIILLVGLIAGFLTVGGFIGSVLDFNREILGGKFEVTGLIYQVIAFGLFVGMGALILKFFHVYNRFVRLREQVRLSRSAIDVTTKRRHTLIPELCDVIAGLMAHEKSVMESIAVLRTQQPDHASKEFMALAENYPGIRSSQNFLTMQNELGRTEEKIAMSRSFLNDSILAMDNLRATLIGMVMSPLFSKENRPNL